MYDQSLAVARMADLIGTKVADIGGRLIAAREKVGQREADYIRSRIGSWESLPMGTHAEAVAKWQQGYALLDFLYAQSRANGKTQAIRRDQQRATRSGAHRK